MSYVAELRVRFTFMSREISEDILRGISKALEIHAPYLLPKIYHLISTGLVDGPKGIPGTSIHGKLTATIPWEDGEPILRVLESIEREQGYNAVFCGRQINFLVLSWRHFSEPKQCLPPP